MPATAAPPLAVPPEAARLTADFAIPTGTPKGDAVPLRLVARTADPVNHWLYGPVVHDLAGMKTHRDRLPVDYCHDYGEVIGYVGEWETADGELVGHGALIATHPRVEELRRASAAGVPFEASIAFESETAVLEDVPAGMSTTANGRTYEGPVNIVRQWNLRGVAICPYGYDRATAAEFSRPTRGTNMPKPPTENLTQTPPADAEPTTPVNPPTDDAAPADDPKKDTPPADPPTDNAGSNGKPTEPAQQNQPEPPADPEPTTEPPAEPANAGAMTQPSDGRRFLDAFGERGAVWFAEGKSFDEARDLYVVELRNENAELRQRLQQAGDAAGDNTPVDHQPAQPTNPRTEQLRANLGTDARAEFAASLNLRRQTG